MIKIVLNLLTIITLSSNLMGQGIQFEKGNWKEALSKASIEKKIIYLDVYTTWCGPCKMMAKNYFPNQEVGTVYNKDFINVSIDAEKGEGLEIAKKYAVSGYPTNLFINPTNEEIIYKTVGMPSDKEGFIQNAIIALLEKNDQMKLHEYEAMFKSNQYDELFLKKYIQKLNRLDINRDKQLDAYVTNYSKDIHSDTLSNFLLQVTNSMNNKGFDFLVSDKKYTKQYILKGDPYKAFIESIMYTTLEEAQQNNNEKNFIDALSKYKTLMPSENEKYFFYKKEYYSQSKDETKKWNANIEYADMLVHKSKDKIIAEDNAEFENVKESILWQIKQMNLSEDKQKDAFENTIKANPRYLHLASSMASTQLNEIAWNTFKQKRNDNVLIKKALIWAEKAVDLSQNDDISSQLAVKDTYAALLYANGKKQEAIKIETNIIELAKKEKLDDVDSFEETLQKMKEGKY